MSGVFKYNRPAFQPDGRYVVRRKFKSGDMELQPGDPFLWQDHLSLHRAKQMYEQRWFDLEEEVESKKPRRKKAVV